MKFGKLVDYKKGILFFKNHAENEARTLVPDPFLFFKKTFIKDKSKWSAP